MKHEPRPAIHMEKPLLTAVSWVGWSLRGSNRANSVSQVDGFSLIAPTCQLYGSIGGWVQKRDNGLCLPFCLGALALMVVDTSVPSPMPLVPFKLLPQCWSSEGVSG